VTADQFNITGGVDGRISDAALQPVGGGSSVTVPAQLGQCCLIGVAPALFSGSQTFKTNSENTPPTGLEINTFGSAPSTLMLLNNVISGFLTSNADYQFKSVSYVRFVDVLGSKTATNFHYFGYPTPVAAIPASGSRSFSTVGLNYDVFTAGTQFGNSNTTTSVSTAVVNYAAKTVTFAVTITSNGTSLGTYNGLGTFTAGTNQFSGTLTASGSALSGNFSGSLFGATGEEVGLAYSLTGTPVISGTTGKRTVIGLVLGK
jgi:hypothetical protein